MTKYATRLFWIALGLIVFLWNIIPLGLVPRHDNDFKHIYLGTQSIIRDASPYSMEAMQTSLKNSGLSPKTPLNPYVYLPFTGLALSFVAPLNIRQASDVMFWLNVLCTLLSLWLIAEICHGKRARHPRPQLVTIEFAALCAIMACAHPLTRTLNAGQLNSILLFALCLGFYLLQCKRDKWAGGLLGFAGMFKLSPLIYLLHFLLTKKFRAFLAMIVACVLFGLVSLIVCGVAMHVDFLAVLRDMGYGHSTWHEYGCTFWKDTTNQSLNSFITHIIVAGNNVTTPWFAGTQAEANIITTVCAMLLLLTYAVTAWRARGKTAREAAYLLAVMTSLLLPSLMWDHYMLQALLPCWWLIAYAFDTRRYLTMIGMFLLLGILMMPFPYDSPVLTHGPNILLMSVKLWPALLIFADLAVICYSESKKND